MQRALLVIDLQNDFYENGALAVENASQINPIVNDLLLDKQYSLIVASQDWHPAQHKSFASNHAKKTFTLFDNQKGIGPILWPDHCCQQTFGAEFNSKIRTEKFDYIIRKGTDPEIDSYSAFRDNDGTDLGLEGLLRGLEINFVDIVGLAFDYCVKFTALDGAKSGFNINLIEAATKAVAPENNEETKNELREAGVNLI